MIDAMQEREKLAIEALYWLAMTEETDARNAALPNDVSAKAAVKAHKARELAQMIENGVYRIN